MSDKKPPPEIPEACFERRNFEIYTYAEMRDFFKQNLNLDTPHRIDFYSLVLVTNGVGIHTIDTSLVPFRAGDLLCDDGVAGQRILVGQTSANGGNDSASIGPGGRCRRIRCDEPIPGVGSLVSRGFDKP